MAKEDIFTFEVDEERFSYFFAEVLRLGKADFDRVLRKQAFDLMAKIMVNWPVDTGRSRMGWSGLHKRFGKFVNPKGKRGDDVYSVKSGAKISRAEARSEGESLARAEDNTKRGKTPHYLIYNSVNYAPYIEAEENVVSNQMRAFTKHFAEQLGRRYVKIWEKMQS